MCAENIKESSNTKEADSANMSLHVPRHSGTLFFSEF